MQQFKKIILLIIIAIFVIFTVQNFNTVSITLFNWKISLPLAFILAGIYVLGMFTGGLFWSSIKKLTTDPEKENKNN